MQTKSNENVYPPESPINGLRCPDFGANSDSQEIVLSGPSDQPKQISLDDSQSFYDKLYGFYEPKGVNLVLNVRETLLNLHVFYKEVTGRGGYNQVSNDKRWEEVSMAMNLNGTEPNLSQQLQRAYAVFLYQFEQHDIHRASQGSKHKSSLDTIDEANKKAKGKGPQKGTSSAYHIFLKKECERLRGSLGEKPAGKSYRSMANDAWRDLSELDRKPYIDESNKDRENFSQELKARREAESRQQIPEDVYHPELGPDFKMPSQVGGQATVDLSVQTYMESNKDRENFSQELKALREAESRQQIPEDVYHPVSPKFRELEPSGWSSHG